MTIYWLLFLFPALMTLSPNLVDQQKQNYLLLVYGIAATLIIGLRYQVGR